MANYSKAPQEVISIAKQLIAEYHSDLQDASIGFLFRDEAPESDGRVTLGMAKKIGDTERVFMDYDFIIWLAEDKFYTLNSHQQTALIDHELTHCVFLDEKAKIRKHDVEEFAVIIQRYGLWWPGAGELKAAMLQAPLFEPERNGRIEAADIGPDVLDQLDDLNFG